MATTLHIAQDERRRHKRLPWRVKLTALSFPTPETRRLDALETVDISYSGLGVVSSRRHKAGEQVVVALPRDNGDCSYVTAKVVCCRREGEGCRLGLQFTHDRAGRYGPGSAA
ncbi:MAG: hypothetical protein GVY16_09050 [Planctomycetes bacterium]|jgi:hypothetical protein|nr:PilZ domain-containing protein [Phycisphaerae bacterium]NBB95870.1 hypothetical protein [Planctomycetota bacterium]